MGIPKMLSKSVVHTFLLIPAVLAGDGCRDNNKHCVCYEEAGGECYSEKSPWGATHQRPIRTLPDSPKQIATKFQLFTQSNKDKFVLLENEGEIPRELDISKRTVFITHGFISSSTKKFMPAMKDKILAHYDYNVVLIDWKNGANVGNFNL